MTTSTADDAGSRAAPRHPAGPGRAADPGKIVAMALRVWGYKQGEVRGRGDHAHGAVADRGLLAR